MKRVLFFAVVSLCLLSCVHNNSTNATSVATKEVVVEKPYKAIELVDTIISIYPNLYVNDVQKERFLQYLYMELDKKLTDDNSFLTEVPVQFAQMLKKDDNKYIVKFEHRVNWSNFEDINDDNDWVVTEKDIEDMAIGWGKDKAELMEQVEEA